MVCFPCGDLMRLTHCKGTERIIHSWTVVVMVTRHKGTGAERSGSEHSQWVSNCFNSGCRKTFIEHNITEKLRFSMISSLSRCYQSSFTADKKEVLIDYDYYNFSCIKNIMRIYFMSVLVVHNFINQL